MAEHFNGFAPAVIGGRNVQAFLANPDHDLLGWAYGMQSTGAYYGAGYLFLVYLYERFGLEFIQMIARSPIGWAGFDPGGAGRAGAGRERG